MAIKEIFT